VLTYHPCTIYRSFFSDFETTSQQTLSILISGFSLFTRENIVQSGFLPLDDAHLLSTSWTSRSLVGVLNGESRRGPGCENDV